MESIKELKKIVEKGVKRRRFSAMYFIEPIQVYITKVLLILGLNRIAVSLIWLFLGLIISFLFITGNVKLGLLAVLLHYLQTILDGCDGQVAKYNKRRLSEERDVQLWSYGLYMDFFQHILIDVFTMSFFAIGVYRITGNFYALILGTIVVYLRMYRRTEYPFLILVSTRLQVKEDVLRRMEFKKLPVVERNFLLRLIDYFFVWVKNGKKFYFLIFWSMVFDIIFQPFLTPAGVVNFRFLFLFGISIAGLLGVIRDQIVLITYGKLIVRLNKIYDKK